MAGRARTARLTPWVLIASAVVAMILAGAAIAGPLLGDRAPRVAIASPDPDR